MRVHALAAERVSSRLKRVSGSDYRPALRFNRLTPVYDLVVGATTRERSFKRALIRQAGIEPGHHVLDVGSGTGTLAIWVKQAEPSASVTGVDADPAILALARSKARKADVAVHFDEAFSCSLPYPSLHFDRALSSLFFHHLTTANKQRTVEELFRVLRPGAELHVADWGVPSNPLMRTLFFSVQLLDGFTNTQDNVSGKLIEMFSQAGVSEVVQREAFNTIYGTLALYSAVKA